MNAIELLHAGSLIIDDVEDGSDERRGHPALHHLVGTPLAINTGNWMYFRSMEMLGELQLSSTSYAEIAARTVKTIRKCHEGQALDIGIQVDELHQREVVPVADAIATWKTGGLMALASWLGASVADASYELSRAMDRFGMQLGVILQMINDLAELRALTAWKGRCDDLRNRRVTWAWAWLASLSRAEDFLWLQQQASHVDNDAQARRLAGRILACVEQHGESIIRGKLAKAHVELADVVGDHYELQRLINRIEEVLVRYD